MVLSLTTRHQQLLLSLLPNSHPAPTSAPSLLWPSTTHVQSQTSPVHGDSLEDADLGVQSQTSPVHRDSLEDADLDRSLHPCDPMEVAQTVLTTETNQMSWRKTHQDDITQRGALSLQVL